MSSCLPLTSTIYLDRLILLPQSHHIEYGKAAEDASQLDTMIAQVINLNMFSLRTDENLMIWAGCVVCIQFGGDDLTSQTCDESPAMFAASRGSSDYTGPRPRLESSI